MIADIDLPSNGGEQQPTEEEIGDIITAVVDEFVGESNAVALSILAKVIVSIADNAIKDCEFDDTFPVMHFTDNDDEHWSVIVAKETPEDFINKIRQLKTAPVQEIQ